MRLATAVVVPTLLLAVPLLANAASGVYDPQVVLDGIAEGKAAKSALRASFKRRQAEIDARKAEADKAQKEGLLELAGPKESLRAFFERNQRELSEEEQAATGRIRERMLVVAEEVRVARGLEQLVEKPAKGRPAVAGEDLTGEVIRAYDARFPVAKDPYGPLTVNRPAGGDLYIAQDGAMVPFVERDGVLVFQLANRPFQIGTGSTQVNLCLTELPGPEVRADPKGFEASCLAGPMQAARERNAADLLVYSGRNWSDGNNLLQEGTQLAAKPLDGYPRAYQVNALVFVDRKDADLATFTGTIHGWVWVYHQPERRNRDVMPIQLVFAGRKQP